MDNLRFPVFIDNPEYPFKETLENNLIRSSMEDGTIKTRPRFTRNRKTYELTWSYMDNDQKEMLDDFYVKKTKNGSKSFKWTHPATDITKIVRFAETPSFTLKMRNYWSVTVKLQEV